MPNRPWSVLGGGGEVTSNLTAPPTFSTLVLLLDFELFSFHNVGASVGPTPSGRPPVWK